MYMKPILNKSTGRTLLCVYETVWNPEKGKNEYICRRNLGYAEDLALEHEDPFEWARSVAKEMTREKKEGLVEINIRASLSEKLAKDGSMRRKNLGYAVFSKLYHEFEIDGFWNDRRRYTKADYNHNSIFKNLVYNRLLYPSSKKAAWENREIFFEDADYSMDDMYRSLDFFISHREALLKKLNRKMVKEHGRNTLLMYYDVTNYYFSIDDNDEADEDIEDGMPGLRFTGCLKEHQTTPIVQMGLFMDEQGIPMSYELFPGNTHDSKTFDPMLKEAADIFNVGNVIAVADKGMMGGDNIRSILLKHQGYVMSSSVRKADAKFKEYVLDDDGYIELYNDKTGELEFKYKSRFTPRKIKVHTQDGGTATVKINERQIVIWSRKYAVREAAARGKVLEKTKKLVGSYSRNANRIVFGARKYIQKVPFSTSNGQILDDVEYVVDLDEEKIDEEAKLDGYYAICTNVVGIPEDKDIPFKEFEPEQKARYNTKDNFLELNRPVSELDIMDMYKGLWRIEETFRVTKSDLEARPVFVSTTDHIRSHFLVCFTALFLMRFLQHRLRWKYSARRIQEELSKACCSPEDGNVYLFDHYSDALEEISQSVGIDLSRRRLTRMQIRQLLGATKKTLT